MSREDKKLRKGCVVMMKQSSGLIGYGNPQCVSSVCDELGVISLYGHNTHYNDYDVEEILNYPNINLSDNSLNLSKESAERLCEVINLNSEFFDESNIEYVCMKKNDPVMWTAMQELFAIANCVGIKEKP